MTHAFTTVTYGYKRHRTDTVHISREDAAKNGFAITPIGFEPLV